MLWACKFLLLIFFSHLYLNISFIFKCVIDKSIEGGALGEGGGDALEEGGVLRRAL